MAKNINYPSTGAECISKFIETYCFPEPFLVTGGACAFIVDALHRNSGVTYRVMQNEQAAAMAADAVYRVNKKIGVTISTSGPGATNLITGIACSWFDSIPSIHVTGQVNTSESRDSYNLKSRQIGFQETDIVSIVESITKYAKKVSNVSELLDSMFTAFFISISDRQGPVLIDVPMDVQKEQVTQEVWINFQLRMEQELRKFSEIESKVNKLNEKIDNFLKSAKSPVVLLGAGLGIAGKMDEALDWLERSELPFATSWNSLSYLEKAPQDNYLGSIGVYGSKFANSVVDASSHVLVLGSRLDNRQRSADPSKFAPQAHILVIDIDDQELAKFSRISTYSTILSDLKNIDFSSLKLPDKNHIQPWKTIIEKFRKQINDGRIASVSQGQLSPYQICDWVIGKMSKDHVVVADCGANLCWVYQSFLPFGGLIFTAGGNSPMGYSLPASIGAYFADSTKQVICFIGDGGLQMNLQELQTIAHNNIPIIIVILNNDGYGIIKQFQDTYFDGRYAASGQGYSAPDFSKLASAYNLNYKKIENMDDFVTKFSPISKSPVIYDIMVPKDALITPKLEMGHSFSDQFPYFDTKL